MHSTAAMQSHHTVLKSTSFARSTLPPCPVVSYPAFPALCAVHMHPACLASSLHLLCLVRPPAWITDVHTTTTTRLYCTAMSSPSLEKVAHANSMNGAAGSPGLSAPAAAGHQTQSHAHGNHLRCVNPFHVCNGAYAPMVPLSSACELEADLRAHTPRPAHYAMFF